MAAETLLRASYGNVRLYLSDFGGEIGREQVTHSPSVGDDHSYQDRGRAPRTTECEVVFSFVPNEEDGHIARYRAFEKLVADGKPQVFVHPLRGSHLAAVGRCREMVSADASEIRLSVEFVPIGPVRALSDVGGGVSPAASPEAVAVAASATDDELAAAGLSSSLPTRIADTVAGWAESADVDSRRVYAELSSLVIQIDELSSKLDLATDFERWPIFRNLLSLRAMLVDSADAMTSSAARVFDLVVKSATPLRVICARYFGASEAEDRAVEVRRMNALRTPGLVPAGIVLKMPVARRRG